MFTLKIQKVKNMKFKEKIKTEDLEKYTCNFITKNFRAQETDIIYKLKDKKVKNKEYEHALVIAIVLYTGPRKWTAKTHIREKQE